MTLAFILLVLAFSSSKCQTELENDVKFLKFAQEFILTFSEEKFSSVVIVSTNSSNSDVAKSTKIQLLEDANLQLRVVTNVYSSASHQELMEPCHKAVSVQ